LRSVGALLATSFTDEPLTAFSDADETYVSSLGPKVSDWLLTAADDATPVRARTAIAAVPATIA
jgi:hypothetical protein